MRIVALALLLAACGPPPMASPDAAPAVPADADTSCGAQTEEIAVENLGDPPDLLVVLDRSNSMNTEIANFPPTIPPSSLSRWTIMRNALDGITAHYQDNIRFGLLEFPTDNNCGVAGGSAVRVPIDINQGPQFSAYFATRNPGGNTPAQLGLAAALAHYNSIPVNPAGRFVLFATDGEPNCSGNPGPETVAAVTALADAGISTYVLGFGDGIVDDTVLEDSAIAGLVPRPIVPHYYSADSASGLANAFATIAGGIAEASCTYALDEAPPVPGDVTVTLAGVPVPRSPSHTNGWDYYPDDMTITFFGSYCNEITGGDVTEVSFIYGCPGPVVP